MLLTFISAQVSAPMTVGTAAATYRDLSMISGLALDEQTIAVRKDFPFKTMKDVVEELKRKPNSLVVGGGGMGGEDQMCNRLLEKASGVKLRYVSFNSGGECITALLGGHVDMVWVNPAEFIPQYEARRSGSSASPMKNGCPISRTFRPSVIRDTTSPSISSGASQRLRGFRRKRSRSMSGCSSRSATPRRGRTTTSSATC